MRVHGKGSGVRGAQRYLMIRKRIALGPYCRPVPRVLGESKGGGRFLMGEVPLHAHRTRGRGRCYIHINI